jgi:hypothetical protein
MVIVCDKFETDYPARKRNYQSLEVARITPFLATFSVHLCAVVTSYKPVLQMIEWLGKPAEEPISCS